MNEQKWPNHLVIVRHGESERNVLKEAAKLSGQTESFSDGIRDMDTVLTEKGGRQALRAGKFLASRYEFDAAFSSPYRRAVETTERILQAYQVRPPAIQEERLRELEFGMFDGLTWEAVKSRHPDEYNRRKREGKYWYRPPGGENRPDVALRVHSFLAARGRTTEKSRAVIRCAARGRSFHPRASGGRVQRDPRNGLPQTQQKARELRKKLPSKVSQLPRRARSQQFPQNQAQVERTHVDQLPFQNVFLAAQMAAPHSARLVAVREAALDQLAAPPQ